MHELAEAVDAALDADDEERPMPCREEGERLGEQLQALEDGLLDYAANVKAAAGAIVSIDRDGLAVIHRGCCARGQALRTLERLQQRFGSEGEAGNDDEGENGYDDRQPKAAAMSDRLAQRLSAHRTAELQIEVARHPQVALAALVHGMVQTVLQESYYGHDLPLGVSLKLQDRLESLAPDVSESPAAVALRTLQEVAGEALPEDSAELFAVLLAKSQDELVRLLAVCVASTLQDRLESLAPDVSESPAAVALRTLQEVAGEALPEDSAELFAVLLAKSQDELVRLLLPCAWRPRWTW